MQRALIGSALGAAGLWVALPATAHSFVAASITASGSDVRNFTFVAPSTAGVRVHRGIDRDSHHRGWAMARSGYGYPAPGYYDYGDFDGNRQFDADRWNDWWHERPERAFPRWMRRNRDCSRQWYSGDVLTC